MEKKVSILGEWAKVKEDISDGDIIEITNEGEKMAGEFGERNVFKVETKNGIKNMSFNQTTMNYLIDAYGGETNEWIGEKARVWVVKSNVGGKMKDIVYLTAPDWVEGEDGFYPPKTKSKASEDDIPVIDEEKDTENIPF